MTTSPPISVIIATCNRPDHLKRCLESLTRVAYSSWDVLVIDQSAAEETEEVVRHYTHCLPGLRLQRMNTRGLSRARNLGLHEARQDLVAFLDDDCTVGPTWLEDIAAVFSQHAGAALVFGEVTPAPHDRRKQFIPEFRPATEQVLRGRLSYLRLGGAMGASMYLRLSRCQTVGPFDIYAGAGAPLHAAEDHDFAYRALANGEVIVVTPNVRIWHFGARELEGEDARHLVRSNCRAYGILDMKFLRSGDHVAPFLIVAHLLAYVVQMRPWAPLLRKGPGRVAQPTVYLQGLYLGLRIPLLRPRTLWGRSEDYEVDNSTVRPVPSGLPGAGLSVPVSARPSHGSSGTGTERL